MRNIQYHKLILNVVVAVMFWALFVTLKFKYKDITRQSSIFMLVKVHSSSEIFFVQTCNKNIIIYILLLAITAADYFFKHLRSTVSTGDNIIRDSVDALSKTNKNDLRTV